jgi:hypothetical protein
VALAACVLCHQQVRPRQVFTLFQFVDENGDAKAVPVHFQCFFERVATIVSNAVITSLGRQLPELVGRGERIEATEGVSVEQIVAAVIRNMG